MNTRFLLPPALRLDPNADVFRFYTHDDLKRLPPSRWIVKGLIPANGIGSIFGPSGAGKSFLSLDLGAHIRHGMPWFGRRVQACPVLYIPLEGQGGMPRRSDAWERKHGKQTGLIYLQDGINLLDAVAVTELIAQVRRKPWPAPVVVFVDTLAQASAGLQENGSEMTAILAAGQRLARELPGVVIFVHHSGHDNTDRMRGWSGLPAAMDFCIACNERGDDKHNRQFTLTKVKDGEAGETVPFALQPMHLGQDADGDEVTSLVVTEAVKIGGVLAQQGATEAQHQRDDAKVLAWIKEEVAESRQPSRAYLESKREAKTGHLSQKALRHCIDRLIGNQQLAAEGSGRNTWLRPIDGGAV